MVMVKAIQPSEPIPANHWIIGRLFSKKLVTASVIEPPVVSVAKGMGLDAA